MSNIVNRYLPNFLLNSRTRVYRHLLLQLILFFITINLFWDTPDELILTWNRFFAWLIFYVVMNVIVYTNIYLLAPRFLMRNRLLLYLLLVVLLILICILTIGVLQSLFVDADVSEANQATIPAWLNILSSVVSIGLLVMGTSAVLLFKSWMSDSMRVGELQAETLRTELNFLKSQINPHFLFNMLNNSYLLIKKKRPEASEVIFKLEDLLRYQLNDSAKEEVCLSSDIRFLSDFLNLEKIRRDKFEFTILKEGNINSVTLPPLLFIPFVENAVKHNSDSDNMSYVNLTFKVSDGKLEFRCVNSKPLVATKHEVGGIGLTNIKRRLDLLYPNRHTLEIVENKQTYTVDLLLEL